MPASIIQRSAFIAMCASIVVSDHVYAEPQANGRPTEESVDKSVLDQEIVVSAQRRDETASKVPISITAFSQTTMDDLSVTSISDLTSIVPGLLIPHASATNNSNPEVAIRGIFSGGNTPTTQIYIDETPVAIREMRQAGPSGAFFPDIFDLERVEVVRGPQGTLFGSSAMGGAIRFITPQPSLHESSGYTRAELATTKGGDPSYAIGAAYGAPLVEGKAGFRVSASYHADGGFINSANPYTGEILERNSNASDAYTARAALALVPTEGLTITPSVYVQRQHTDTLSSVYIRPFLGDDTSGDSPNQPNTDRIVIPSLDIKYELPGGLTFQSDTSYLDRKYDTYDEITQLLSAVFSGEILAVPPDYFFEQRQYGGTKSYQQEFRLSSSNDGRLQWVAGAFYRHSRERITQTGRPDISPLTEALFGQTTLQFFGVPAYVLNGDPYTQYTMFNTVDEERALFGDITYAITDKFKVGVGLRVEHSVVKDQTQDLAGPFSGSATLQHVTFEDQSEDSNNPRLTLTYQFNDRHMVYATGAKGFRQGGANDAANVVGQRCRPVLDALGIEGSPLTFDSDGLWSYEVGAKDSVLDGRLSFQTSAFHIDWKDIQTQINQQGCGTFTVNRGKAVVNGVELQFAAAPMKGLKVGGNVSYTDAYYPDASFGVNLTPGGTTPLLNGKNDKLAGVLPWTAALNAEYSWSIGGLWDGARSYVRAIYRWQDGSPAGNPGVARFDPYKDEFRDPAYETLNLRVGVTRGGLDLSAFVDNATNSDPLVSFTDLGIGGPNYPLSLRGVNRPLTAGFTGLYRF